MASIVDFGCQGVSFIAAMPEAVLAVLLFVLLASLGSAVGGAKRWVPADIMTGWGILTVVFTCGGIFIPGSLPICAAVAGVACLAAIAMHMRTHKRLPVPSWLVIILVLQIWILVLINRTGIAGWDDIAQWAPNAVFLWRHDAFPSLNLALSYSNRPIYPYALAYLDYALSLSRGAFVVQAGAMINWLLLASFAWALTEFEGPGLRPIAKLNPRYVLLRKFMRISLAMMLVTIFNPGFNASFSITGQTDLSTSVAVGFITLLLLRLHIALNEKDQQQLRALSWQIALSAIVMTLLRDMNIILWGLLVGASLLVALRQKYLRPALRALVPGILSAVICFAIWHVYAQHAVVQDKPLTVLPFAEWHWPMLPQTLSAMGKEMLKKNGFYALMLGLSAFGVWAFLRGKLDRSGTLAAMIAITFIGNILFILIVFMGATVFTERNVAEAMSFYRYGTHVGLMGVVMLWFLFERYLEPRLDLRKAVMITVFGFNFLPFVYQINPRWLVAQPSPALCEARRFGNDIAQRLPPQSRLVILDSTGNGFEPFIINFQMALDDLTTGHQSRMVTYMNSFEPEKWPDVLEQIKSGANIDAVLLTQPSSELKQFFNLAGSEPRYLLLRQGKEWQSTSLSSNNAP